MMHRLHWRFSLRQNLTSHLFQEKAEASFMQRCSLNNEKSSLCGCRNVTAEQQISAVLLHWQKIPKNHGMAGVGRDLKEFVDNPSGLTQLSPSEGWISRKQ